MKIILSKLSLALISTTILVNCIKVFASKNSFQQNNLIVGTWVATDDKNWKIVFVNNNKCYEYYKGALSRTETWSISNTSPQCGITVPVDLNSAYLKLVNISNSNDFFCYEIASLTSQALTIRVVDQSKFMMFDKQP